MLSVIGIAVYLRFLFMEITVKRNPGKNLSFSRDDGSTYAPLPFSEELGDSEEIKKLIKKRNKISILFCFMFLFTFVLGYFLKTRGYIR